MRSYGWALIQGDWYPYKKRRSPFYLVAAEKATWVTSSSTGAIRENSARVLALAGSAQTGHGLIRKYGLKMCRQCFCQYAKDIGFIKLD